MPACIFRATIIFSQDSYRELFQHVNAAAHETLSVKQEKMFILCAKVDENLVVSFHVSTVLESEIDVKSTELITELTSHNSLISDMLRESSVA